MGDSTGITDLVKFPRGHPPSASTPPWDTLQVHLRVLRGATRLAPREGARPRLRAEVPPPTSGGGGWGGTCETFRFAQCRGWGTCVAASQFLDYLHPWCNCSVGTFFILKDEGGKRPEEPDLRGLGLLRLTVVACCSFSAIFLFLYRERWLRFGAPSRLCAAASRHLDLELS